MENAPLKLIELSKKQDLTLSDLLDENEFLSHFKYHHSDEQGSFFKEL